MTKISKYRMYFSKLLDKCIIANENLFTDLDYLQLNEDMGNEIIQICETIIKTLWSRELVIVIKKKFGKL